MNERTNEQAKEQAPSFYSFTIESEADLIQAFRYNDQKKLVLPNYISYPLKADHYFAWREPSGVYVYMVFKKPDWKSPIGIAFKRSHTGSHLSNSRLCDWCLSYGPSDLVVMLSVTLNSRQTSGMMLCLDLGCSERLEEAAELSGKSFEKLAHQLYERIGKFFESVLRQSKELKLDETDVDPLH